ncbi:MAG: hypothetical protein GX650_01100 [Clostridiales bacterium]|nr:hypothetical protein [Clostridiales bacterium]
MYQPGDPVIAYSRDQRDEYYALIVEPARSQGGNALVEIHRVLRYPIQHAIMWPDVPNSVKPLDYLCKVRLAVKRPARQEDVEHYQSMNYEASLRHALRHAYEDAKVRQLVDEQVLKDHMLGKVPRNRVVLVYE